MLASRENGPVESPETEKTGEVGRIGETSKKSGRLEETFTDLRQDGEKALSKSESDALLRRSLDGQLSRAATTGDSTQLTTYSGDTLFRTDASATNASQSESPAPVTRDDFLERLPKRVIRGGKLIDVRPEIAQLLGAPASARAPDARKPEEGEGKRGERVRSLAESSTALSGIKGNSPVKHDKRDGCDLSPAEVRSGETETGGKKEKVRLKVRGAEAETWLVKLPTGATVGQLYRAVEKLR